MLWLRPALISCLLAGASYALPAPEVYNAAIASTLVERDGDFNVTGDLLDLEERQQANGIFGRSLALEPRQSAYGPPDGATLRLLPLGDSITNGYPTAHGYRQNLIYLLQAKGYFVSTVGTQIDDRSPALPANQQGHEGYNGAQIGYLQLQEGKTRALAKNPNIVLLLIGINDVIAGNSGNRQPPFDQIGQRLGSLIDYIVSFTPSAVVYVGKLLPEPDFQQYVDQVNAQIPGIVKQRADQGKKVAYCDFSNIPTSQLYDGLHPNDQGYQTMAQRWYYIIQATPRSWFTVPPLAPGN